MFNIVNVSEQTDFKHAAILFTAYANSINIDLSFQHFQSELETLHHMYALPYGMIFLCKQEETVVGCVAVRKIDNQISELKRMYVIPKYQGMGIGQMLLDEAIGFAKKAGYEMMRLDTLNTMKPAMHLYQKNGFYSIPAYYQNPEPTAAYFEKKL
jgi:ribosomal protein S18 acetylase RimI-like enzyme